MPPSPPSTEFVKLLMRHEDELLTFILPLAGCFDDAREILQSTAVSLWQKFDQYDKAKPFLPWAKQFARFEVLAFHKRERKYVFFSPELMDSLIDHQARLDDASDDRRHALMGCVEKLPKKDRVLLDQRYHAQMTIRQAAQESGRSEDALYQALTRLRRALLDCVDKTLAMGDG